MAGHKLEIATLLQGLQRTDPKLHELLRLLALDTQELHDQLNPIELRLGVLEIPGPGPLPPLNFTVTPVQSIDVLRFEWIAADEFSRSYEIRKGTIWDTAFFVGRTSNLRFDADPILVGSHDYLIKSINSDNVYSIASAAATVIITAIGLIIPTSQVIDNNVLLRWNTPSSVWDIIHYELYRDSTFLGIHSGTFAVIFEDTGGTFTYYIRAKDVAGNLSNFGSITVIVAQPPDFELYTTLFWTSGAKTFSNALNSIVGNYLHDTDGTGARPFTVTHIFLPVNIAETYQAHFTARGWNSYQDQVNAGYPYFIEPTINGTGYIELKWDLGAIITNVIMNLDWTQIIVFGNVAIATTFSWSDDDFTYTSPIAGTQAFAPSLRYLKVRLTGTTIDDTSLAEIFDLQVRLDVKRENDGGEVTAVSTDASGTVVTFNKLFRDIDTITATARITEGVNVIIDFVDAPNPTSFKVYAFDYSGQRITCSVRWAARGII